MRNNIIKLIIDLRASREEATKQKFRFEYTENLVRIAHAERDYFKETSESQKETIDGLANERHDLINEVDGLKDVVFNQKAITELAVEVLKRISWADDSGLIDHPRAMIHIADEVLKQIERLQNE